MATAKKRTPFWDAFVKKPRDAARAILLHAYHGNWEAERYYTLFMAQAKAGELMLREMAAERGVSIMQVV